MVFDHDTMIATVTRRLNKLTIAITTQPGYPERPYYELVVDAKPLSVHIEQATGEERFGGVCPLGWTVEEYAQAYAARLLLLEPPVLPSGRSELLVCPMCADLGCGCIAARIRREAQTYVWEQLCYETDYDSEIEEPFRMGAFVFAASQYEAALGPHAGSLARELGGHG